jgi:hypothetical protein
MESRCNLENERKNILRAFVLRHASEKQVNAEEMHRFIPRSYFTTETGERLVHWIYVCVRIEHTPIESGHEEREAE